MIKFLKKLINWFLPSMQDGSGESSYKRLTIFAFVISCLYVFNFDKITNEFILKAYYTNVIFIAVMAGLITVPQIIEIIKYRYSNNDEDENNSETNNPNNIDNPDNPSN